MGVKVEDSARPDPRQGRCFMSRQQGPNYKTLVLWYSVDKLYHLASFVLLFSNNNKYPDPDSGLNLVALLKILQVTTKIRLLNYKKMLKLPVRNLFYF